MTEDELSYIIIQSAIKVHKILGPGLLEKVYMDSLYHLLVKEGLYVEREKPIPVIFEELRFDCGYRADIVVENKVLIEGKSVDVMHPIHKVKTLTYLRLGGYKLGLLINFNVSLLKYGIRRVVNNL